MTSPIEHMHPLLYPPVTSSTPGWLFVLLAACTLCILALLVLFLRRRKRPEINNSPPSVEQFRQQALLELEQIPHPSADEFAGPWLQQLNQLLKRLCSVRYPEHDSHRLTGRQWLAFLDSRCPAAGLTRWMILVEGSYQPECRMQEAAIEGLHTAIKTWIEKHA